EQGSIGFLEWMDRRFLGARAEAVSWQTLSRQRPELCDAALRLHHADLLRLPPGARLSEQHRRDPDADDWARLIEDWMRHHLLVSEEPSDRELAAAIRRTLPASTCAHSSSATSNRPRRHCPPMSERCSTNAPARRCSPSKPSSPTRPRPLWDRCSSPAAPWPVPQRSWKS